MKESNLNETKVNKIITECIYNILNEAKGIKSQKLYNIVQQHGGIESNGIFDIHNLTDDDVFGVVTYYQWVDIVHNDMYKFAYKNGIELGVADTLQTIELKDGNYVLCRLRGGKHDRFSKQFNANRKKEPGDFEYHIKKRMERESNRYPRKTDYVWNNKNAEELFHNPFFKKGKGNWTPERKTEAMNNVRNNRQWFDKNNKKSLG